MCKGTDGAERAFYGVFIGQSQDIHKAFVGKIGDHSCFFMLAPYFSNKFASSANVLHLYIFAFPQAVQTGTGFSFCIFASNANLYKICIFCSSAKLQKSLVRVCALIPLNRKSHFRSYSRFFKSR